MRSMFNVRSPRVPLPFKSLESGLFRACHFCRAATTQQALPPSGSHTSPPASHALPLTRQSASAFNQPLSFDTSSVTEMSYLFSVRSPRVPMAPKP